jgi:phenylacetate-CoA ligase
MTIPDAFYDERETRPPAAREADLMARLAALIDWAQHEAPAYARSLADVQAVRVSSRAALARLPVTRKSELVERQHAARADRGQASVDGGPFGGHATIGWGATIAASRRALRVFASPGGIYEPEGSGRDYWRMGRALHAAGFRAGDLAHNGFSYHFTPAASMMETGAHAIGCTVFPGGTGQTELQVQAMRDLAPAGYMGTPSFLKVILEKADELGVKLPSLVKASVGGEAFPPMLRDWLLARGVAAYQSYGTADLGLVAYETPAREGLVLDEDVIVEIVRPGTGDPVPDGEVGEVVVTTLNRDYPLIRFATGDLSAVLPGPCPTGRTNARIRGWLGRADQTTKVRGMFVHPSQVAEIVRRHAEVQKARLVVDGEMANDRMALRIEVAGAPEGLAARVAESIREVTKLRGDVELCMPGSLPNDGKVIEDARQYR